MPKITIIDGNSLLFRAYYATAYPGVDIMRSPDGTPTNAIFAFSNMINKIVSDIKEGESLFVAFDAGKHNFRHDALETYKANRKPAPEDLVKQFPLVREFLKCFGIFQFEEEGFEGDDIAGTIAKLSEKQGYEVHIYTSDRDFIQLVTNNTYVHILKKGLSDVMIMTPELVEETYGFKPLQIIDYKGLRGDSSDNLPGIPGVGEKTAVSLIQQYESFDNIIAHADEIKGKLGENIKANQELGKLCRDLAIIKTDIDLPFSISDTEYKGYEFSSLNEFCQKYSLKTFISKACQKWKRNNIQDANVEVQTINSFATFDKPNKLGIALDFEDEDYTNSSLFGIALSFNNKVYYESLDNFKKDTVAQDWLKDNNVKKYCYDYKSIMVALSLSGFEINGLEFDILLASYLLDSSIKSTPEVVMNLYGVCLTSQEESIGLFAQENADKTGKIAYYSLVFKEKVYEELNKINAIELYETLELPLTITLAEMEIEGVPVDSKVLDELSNVFKAKINDLSRQIFTLADEEFNLSSPKQVGEILFNKLGLKSNKKSSTSSEVLNEIRDQHPIVDLILEHRKYFKIVSTYTEALKNHIHKDGKIHAKFNQALTTTGRLSSSDPNLQNISVRDEEGKLVRKAFYYEDDQIEILSLDYSQIELRILASLSKCVALQEIFKSGEDIHAETAKKIFNLSEVDSSHRRKAKTVNFGIVYGISDWGLSEQLQIPVGEAKTIINNFYNSFPEISNFFQMIINNAMNDGYVTTLLGRRRYLRELNDSNYQVREFAKRAAMNAPIQGTAADLIKIAMIKVQKAIKENNLKSKMVLQIHDELLFKVYKDEKDKLYNLVKGIMENALFLEVPLEVDGGFGKTWYEAK